VCVVGVFSPLRRGGGRGAAPPEAGQAVVGDVLFFSVWSAGIAIGLPFLAHWCVVGLSRGQ